MKTVILNLRGTSGAGKSTVAHTLLKTYTHEVVRFTGKRGNRPLVYRVDAPWPIYLFGAYHTQCGGCDGITDYPIVLPELLNEFAGTGHILFEGLLISGGYGRVGEAMAAAAKKYSTEAIWALLDTPLELCLERIAARRAARGKLEPLNPKNTEQKYRAALMSQEKLAREGHRTVMISHKRPYSQVMQLFGVELRKEPRHATAEDHS